MTYEDQVKMITLVGENGCDKWRFIAEQMNLKNRREAILEFLRIKLSDNN